ncbi:hypothetical protein [Actinoplanes regularis]|uniref:Uncharacterized protein n=1 Tax=Actinoplanes regularis TaxID=52697 RepID=A0A238UUX8_9ACTN|nr:hypothetical protein [Actinoplanes regularis]GIE84422.1 hypothetical protein Are01nite_09020 [Actinoplanes regularis]SNR25537.1 hypothetical protein SAMN06264365_101156 [Actinoplanes regularis]
MRTELVRYDGGAPSFTVTVVEFAGAIEPLLGLSGLVAKVMASRVEAERIKATAARDRQQHERAMTGMRQQATAADRHSRRMYQAKKAEIAAAERADVRRGEIELSRLERDFDAALCAIKVEGAVRRHEADRRFATEMHRIDSALQAEMARLADRRRRDQQSFALARQRLRLAEKARSDIGKAMSEATRMMRGRSRFAEIAALTVPALSQAMAAVVTRQQDGTVAVLDALCLPQRPMGGGKQSRG